jgi:hypothetical protein
MRRRNKAMGQSKGASAITRLTGGRASKRETAWWAVALLSACVLFSLFTVFDQVMNRTGIEFLLNDQLTRHQRVLDGTAVDPWQYRLLPEYVVEAAIRIARGLGLSSPVLKAFVAVRVAQNLLIFLVAAAYWSRLGLKRVMVLVGLAALAWGITYSGYASDLAFSTYFDVLFYLLSATLILERRYWWVLLVVAVACLNRETSGLIPAMLVATAWRRDGGGIHLDRRLLAVAALGFALCVAGYGGLRIILGPREMMHPYDRQVGLDLLVFNLTNSYTYVFGFSMMSVFPFVAFFYWRIWPEILHRFFWAIVPIWVAVHLFFGALAEARLLLVPYAVVLMPAALLAVQRSVQGQPAVVAKVG